MFEQFFKVSLIEWIDLALTVLGFGIAIFEIRKVKSSAEASKDATEKTLQSLVFRTTIADVSSVVGGLREVQIALRGERYETALLRIQAIRISLHQLKSRDGLNSQSKQIEIQDMIVSLSKFQGVLEKKLHNNDYQISIPSANNRISDFINQLSEWIEELRFTSLETNNDSR